MRCMYPPHMSHMRCMYPPPHMTCMYPQRPTYSVPLGLSWQPCPLLHTLLNTHVYIQRTFGPLMAAMHTTAHITTHIHVLAQVSTKTSAPQFSKVSALGHLPFFSYKEKPLYYQTFLYTFSYLPRILAPPSPLAPFFFLIYIFLPAADTSAPKPSCPPNAA